jgi:BirA family biotin operon repressor/biotin-[acetyl-CoA-carboxylase] ligase
LFNQQQFLKELAASWLGRSFFFFEELTSTNSKLKAWPDEDISQGMLLLADKQTAGRGQYSRSWIAEPESNLTFSILLKPTQDRSLHVLTLAFALAVAEMIQDETGVEASIKWPNDVMVAKCKIAGFLTESTYTGSSLNRLVIGLGLNVNQEHFPDELEGKATSMKKLSGKTHSRETLLADLCSRFEYAYRRWSEHETDLIVSINKKIQGFGEMVQVRVNGELLPGKYKLLGIGEEGHLRILNKQLEVDTFSHEQIRIEQL